VVLSIVQPRALLDVLEVVLLLLGPVAVLVHVIILMLMVVQLVPHIISINLVILIGSSLFIVGK